jgi:hypothetical protein
MNVKKLKGPEKMLQLTGKCKQREHKSGVLLYFNVARSMQQIYTNTHDGCKTAVA